jgi:hypothetical protein
LVRYRSIEVLNRSQTQQAERHGEARWGRWYRSCPRSEEIQTILKLDEIGQTRSALNTAQNKLHTAYKTATAQVNSARNALQLHLEIPTLRAEDLLETVNSGGKCLICRKSRD